MADNGTLPEEDRSQISPEGLRNRENANSNTAGGQSWGASNSTAGQSGGASNSTAGGSGGGATSSTGDGRYAPASLKNKEESPEEDNDGRIGEGYDTSNNSSSTGKLRAKITRRRAAIGGGILGVGVGGIVLISSIAQGPGMLVDLSETLQKPSFGSNQTSKLTMGKLFRWWKTGDASETRVGLLGSKVVGNTLDELYTHGIDFQRDSLGQIKSVTIDTGKLQKDYPQLKGMKDAERIAFLKDTFPSLSDLTEATFVKDGGTFGTRFKVDTGDFGVGDTRLLLKDSLATLDDGKVLTAIKFRKMADFFHTPSLFHPIERASAASDKKNATAVEAKAEEEKRLKALEQPIVDEAAPAKSNLKDKLTNKNLATGALLVTQGLCLIRDVVGDVNSVNSSIVDVTSVKTIDKIGGGEQVKSGQDISASQAGGMADSTIDSNGRTVYGGKAFQALRGDPQTGPDIPNDYRQAFAQGNNPSNINQYLGGEAGAIACSTPGRIIQGVATIGLVVSGFFDAGVSWQAYAAKESVGAVGTAGAITLIQNQFTNLLANKAIVPTVLSGPLGGNLMAFGARAAFNMGARSAGGVALSATASAALAEQQQQQDQQQFRSESFFARMFDTKDYRSLTSRLATSLSPSLTQNVASATTGFMNIGTLLPHTLSSLLMPKAQAADSPYDWGFPLYGIPSSILNDPSMQNPYDNADKVAAQLDAGDPSGYTEKAKTCFGVVINKDSGSWDVTPTDLVNPNSDDYANANCANTSDAGWNRVILFVSDTETMEAAACYQGDNNSCTNLGYASLTSGPNAGDTSTVAASGSTQQLAQQILANNKITYDCGSSAQVDINDAKDGKNGTAGAPVSSAILQLIATVGETHSVCVSALESYGQGHTTGSYHYTGDAVDFGSVDGVRITGRNAPALTIIQIAYSVLPKGSALGQSGCGSTPPAPAGWDPPFDDSCDHLHVQVPRGTP
jgi:hypothetical protein